MQENKVTEEYIKGDDYDIEAVPVNGGEREGWRGKLENFISGAYFVPMVIVLVSVIAFSLGRISGLQDKKPPVRIISDNSPLTLLLQQERGTEQTESASVSTLQNTAAAAVSSPSTTSQSGQVVASKNGTKYHYPWCAGAKQISAQNLITFNSIEEARAKGYTPATNCKGLK